MREEREDLACVSFPPQWRPEKAMPVWECGQPHGRIICERGADEGVRKSADGVIFPLSDPYLQGGGVYVIRTADCAPLLMRGERYAVLMHAGWRSVADGIIQEGERLLREQGEKEIKVTAGPLYPQFLIQRDECYERLRTVCSEECFEEVDGGLEFSFWRGMQEQARGLEWRWVGVNTYETAELASWRRDQKKEWLNRTVLGLKSVMPSVKHAVVW